MKKILLFIFISIFGILSISAKNKDSKNPKLVIGIVVDQMRWDYLYKYQDKYSQNGFKRLLRDGFSCENTFINYLPSYTAVGHSTIYTGSVPSIHGIVSNDFYDRRTNKSIYCTDDNNVKTVGSNSDAGKMSPIRLNSTTITDELEKATNFKSKVIGLSLKDRASILPAGHNPSCGAFWYDSSIGGFITSTYYTKTLPEWVDKYNKSNRAEYFMKDGWKTVYPISTYTNSTKDDSPWEGSLQKDLKPVFPYDTKTLFSNDKNSIRNTPFGNSLTLDFAVQAISNLDLGKGDEVDFLAINCASTDYVGHMFGINSIELEDTYIRFDKDIEEFLNFLDKKIGKNEYTIFLTADHGAAHAVGYDREYKMPGGNAIDTLKEKLNNQLFSKFKIKDLIKNISNEQIYFDLEKVDKTSPTYDKIVSYTKDCLIDLPMILYALRYDKLSEENIPNIIRTKLENGYNQYYAGDIRYIMKDNYMDADVLKGTTHGSWNSYDTHIPLIFMGKGIKPGKTYKTCYMTDIAPTMSAYLKLPLPSGSIGNVITEVLEK